MTVDKGVNEGDSSAAAVRAPVSPIEFRLDPASGVPTHLQLVHQVEHAMRLGYLKPGDQLPKVRDAVASLAINPNTVLKAYRELEIKGLAAGRPGQGTFITATLSQATLPDADPGSPIPARLARHRRHGRAGRGMGWFRSSPASCGISVTRRGSSGDRGVAGGETEGVA